MENGYEGASVGEIARQANASKQTLYSRYPTKAKLFMAVMGGRCEGIFERIVTILESNEPAAIVLESFALELLDSQLKKRKDWQRLVRTIISGVEKFPELADMFWEIGPARAHKALSAFIAERVRKGELQANNPEEMAHVFLALCLGRYVLQDLLGVSPAPSTKNKRTYIREGVRVFLAAYAQR